MNCLAFISRPWQIAVLGYHYHITIVPLYYHMRGSAMQRLAWIPRQLSIIKGELSPRKNSRRYLGICWQSFMAMMISIQ